MQAISTAGAAFAFGFEMVDMSSSRSGGVSSSRPRAVAHSRQMNSFETRASAISV